MPRSKRGLATGLAPSRPAAAATSPPRWPVTTTTSSTPIAANAATARARSVRPPRSASGLNPPMRDERPAARTIADVPAMRQADLPARTWIISATMLTASSSGVSAPMSSPMGEWTRLSAPSSMPPSRNAAIMRVLLLRLAMRPM
ncbi:MAG: hypothetical protein BWY94_01987 [Actinobacteria bacterium ADurb.BinA094]|nr:MAG: hypothetical protein BWY94_01987 [Actinobacteria bacterium ADurb.BinA094]